MKEGIGPQLPRPNRVRVPTRRELASYGIKLPSQRMAEEKARESDYEDDADELHQDELARQFAAQQNQRYGEEYQHDVPSHSITCLHSRTTMMRPKRSWRANLQQRSSSVIPVSNLRGQTRSRCRISNSHQ